MLLWSYKKDSKQISTESTNHDTFLVIFGRLKNGKKTMRDTRAKLFFCQSKPIPFSLLQELPVVVIQTFCYHSNVTSHFSSLFSKERDKAPLKH